MQAIKLSEFGNCFSLVCKETASLCSSVVQFCFRSYFSFSCIYRKKKSDQTKGEHKNSVLFCLLIFEVPGD